MTEITLAAPAKLNLHLEVIGRRVDGFHELRTLYQSIDLCDTITVRKRTDNHLTLSVDPDGAAPSDATNLVLRAAQALRQATGVGQGASLVLRKNIPAGGGLGGGSADAAATLVALNRMWRCELQRAELSEIAATLGSDIPFFLVGGLALGIGRGDEVYPLSDLPQCAVLVVTPDIEIPTPTVYHRLDAPKAWKRQNAKVWEFASGQINQPPWKALHNDLQGVVIEGWPEVEYALSAIESTSPVHAAVTGSGATVYGIYQDRVAATRAAQTLVPWWRIHVGVTWGRDRARLET